MASAGRRSHSTTGVTVDEIVIDTDEQFVNCVVVNVIVNGRVKVNGANVLHYDRQPGRW